VLSNFAQTEEQMDLIFRFLGCGVYFFPALWLHFILVLTRRQKILSFQPVYPFLYAYGFIRSYEALKGNYTISRFVSTEMGISPVYATDHPFYIIYNIYYVVFYLVSLALLINWQLKTPNSREKRQAGIITLSTATAFIFGTVIDFALPAAGIHALPPLVHLVLILPVLGVYYAMKKFGLFSWNADISARKLLSRMNDAVFILNPRMEVVFVNSSAEKLFGMESKDLLHIYYPLLLNEEEKRRFFVDFLQANKIDRIYDLEADVKITGERIIHISMAISSIQSLKQKRLLGLIVIARDFSRHKEEITEKDRIILRLKKELRTAHETPPVIPICSRCKRIRDADGNWHSLEEYLSDHVHLDFTHGICPDCERP
jgi:PAS domain S-box-containing protein